jgi:S-adenosylmethionine:tRNA ribosyltransferase-isomerase
LRAELFDYPLPEAQIARRPPATRDGGRLLVVAGGEREHRWVREFAELVPERALLVLNDTRVRRARLFGARRPAGGKVELLLLEACGQWPDGREHWRALGRASKTLREGTLIDVPELEIEVVARAREEGLLELAIRASAAVEDVLERAGRVPIPPYLDRDDDEEDVLRYQTVYARRTASVAAPTAGLHFDRQMFERLSAAGVEIGHLDLEVGLGTFRPVTADDLDQHPMHQERFSVDQGLVEQVRAARARRAPVVAVGTTVVRALESAADLERDGEIRAFSGATRLLIQPGYRFRVVDALFTNFHQPRSTLLALVSAFAGYDAMRAAYADALASGYRFLSYGDAMWIPRRAGC